MVWDLLSPVGRLAVLDVATAGGLDVALAARLRENTADAEERSGFLTDLVRGLRVDLREVDPDEVRCVALAVPGAELSCDAATEPAHGLGIGARSGAGSAIDDAASSERGLAHESARGPLGARVRLEMPADEGLGGYLPVGELRMSWHHGRWAVDGLRLLSWGPAS